MRVRAAPVNEGLESCADANNTASLEPTSPRSVDACLHLGIEPSELKYIAQSHFLKNLGDKDLAGLALVGEGAAGDRVSTEGTTG